MLTAIRQSDNVKVFARTSEKVDAPFYCPGCRLELVLRKGSIKLHHFAHKPPVTCSFGAGESMEHLRAKLEIFDALCKESNVSDLELEKDFGTSIADVYACISGTPVAIEVQRSTLSVNDIITRTRNYHLLGISVIWIGLPPKSLSSEKYSPRAWEKWLHAAYYGRMYYWCRNQTVRPVHFGNYSIRVEESSWHNEDGDERSAGGYDRNSIRWRTPILGVPSLISQDFKKIKRTAWSGGTVHVPECSLYIDKQDKWWR